MADNIDKDITALTVQLLSAFVSNNIVSSEDLAELIRTTRQALIADPAPAAEEPAETFTPAVSVRKSTASRQHIISLIDGKPYKTLKRHLASHGLTPDEYRARYGLPKTYPIVAQDYSDARREVAKRLGLGNRRAAVKAAAPKTGAKRGRPAKAKDAAAAGSPANASPPAPAEKRPARAKLKIVSPSASSSAAAPAKAKAPRGRKPGAAKANGAAPKPAAGATAETPTG